MDVHKDISRLLQVEKTLEEQLKVNAEQKQRLKELEQTIHERDAKVNELQEVLEQRDAPIDFGKDLLQKMDKAAQDLAREVRNEVNAYVSNLLKDKMDLQNCCEDLEENQVYLQDQLDQADQQHLQDEIRNVKLEAEMTKMKQELKQQELGLIHSVLERNSLQRKVDELKGFLEQRDALIEFGKDLLKKKDKEFKDLVQEARKKVNEYVGGLFEKNIYMKMQVEDIENATIFLQEQLDEAEQQHLEAEETNMKLESELAKSKKDLEQQLDELENYRIEEALKNVKIVDELEETKRKLKESEAENEALKTRLQESDGDAETKDQNKEEQDTKKMKQKKKRRWWKCWE
uniref:Uncharacterized protein n=1 Tax=Knipowitschia caucasica TaxID=637954 RepID=A0AAV2LW27_KNICA